MPYSDSSYVAVTRHRRSFSASSKSNLGGGGSRPPVLEIVDDDWAADKLSDDEVDVEKHEAAIAPLLEEGELDADAIVVSPTGNSASAANSGKSIMHISSFLSLIKCVVCSGKRGRNLVVAHHGELHWLVSISHDNTYHHYDLSIQMNESSIHWSHDTFFLQIPISLLLQMDLATKAAERRRREEGWNDLGLDQLDSRNGNNPWSLSNAANWNSNHDHHDTGGNGGGDDS